VVRQLRPVMGGTVLVLHGLAHALPGMQIAAGTRSGWLGLLGPEEVALWTGTLLWSAAMTGFVAAGFGRLGAAAFRRHWRGVAKVAAVASLALLLCWPTAWTIPGTIIDLAVLARVRGSDALLRRPFDSSPVLATSQGGDRS
jgi:hypothetical protein